MHTCIHTGTHSLIHSFTQSLIHSFTHSLIHSFNHSIIHSLIHSSVHGFPLLFFFESSWFDYISSLGSSPYSLIHLLYFHSAASNTHHHHSNWTEQMEYYQTNLLWGLYWNVHIQLYQGAFFLLLNENIINEWANRGNFLMTKCNRTSYSQKKIIMGNHERMNESVNEWLNDWMSGWVNEWMSEWVTEWMSHSVGWLASE
jgi:hypothetical protein